MARPSKPPVAKTTDDMTRQMETLARVGTNRRVAEATLRFACLSVAEKLCALIGESCALPRSYRIVNVDPDSQMLGTPPRPLYLVLVDVRDLGKGQTRTYALSSVPIDAQDRFDFPPAGRLTLTRFAEAIQTGWLVEVAAKLSKQSAALAAALKAIETTKGALL